MLRVSFLLFLALLINAASAFVAPGGPAALPNASRTVRATAATQLHGYYSPESAARNLAVAGRIPWKKLRVTRAQRGQILSIMRAETQCVDLALMFVMSLFTGRIGAFVYNRFLHVLRGNVDYDDSITHEVAETIAEASRLAVLCYFFDAFEVALEVVGMKGKQMDVSRMVSKVIYATWAILRARMYKRSFFEAVVNRTPTNKQGKQGLVDIFDKVADFFLFAVLALIWIDIFKIKRGNGLSSIFALGGAGTLAFTLACQDLAKKALNSLALTASDAFYVGDSIVLGDGTRGVVVEMGWLNTKIRGADELVTRIPNTQLVDMRISNVSRLQFSQVKQDLRFFYDDLDKIPDLCSEIKEEIAASCPKVVTDGSRTFRVRWTDFEADHVKVKVDCRLENPPQGEGCAEARQGILEAITRATRRKGVPFAVPTRVHLAK